MCEPQWCGSKCVFFFLSLTRKHRNAPAVKADAETYLPTLYCPSGQQAHSVRCLFLRVVRGSDFNHTRQVRMHSVQAHRVATHTHTHTHISHQQHQFRRFPNPKRVMICGLLRVSHSFFSVSASASICLSLHLCISVSILLLLSIHTSSLTALLSPPSSAWRDFCLLTAYLMFNALWFPPRHLQAWKERRGGRKFNNRVKRGETEEDKGRPWL